MSRGSIVLLLSLAAGIRPGIAAADLSKTSRFDIPPQQLPSALLKYSEQSGVQVTSAGTLIEGKDSPGVVGTFDAKDALKRLLRGTTLGYDVVDNNTVVIVPSSSPPSPENSRSPSADQGSSSARSKEDKDSKPRDRLQLAQVDQGTSESASTVEKRASQAFDGRSIQLEEVVVTAQKRQERLIDVPLDITAVTSGDIEARGVTSIDEMQYAIPGLTTAEVGAGRDRIQLDGVGTSLGATGLPTVGIYLDEMPITGLTGLLQMDVRLLDMDRVEVLHGPQPTLYGEGSMGGTIRYVTASPDLHQFVGSIDGDWGRVTDGANSYRATGVLNAPLVDDKVGVRLVAGYERDGGWIDSSATGQKDVNGISYKTARVKVLARPADAWSISLLYLHEDHRQDYENFGAPNRITETVFPTNNGEKSDLANLVVSYDFAGSTLTSSTGYLRRDADEAFDLTAYLLPFLPFFGVTPSQIAAIHEIGQPNSILDRAFTEELRLGSRGSGPLNYLVGAYYRNYRSGSEQSTVVGPGSLPFELFDGNQVLTSKSWSAFAEVRYAVTPKFQALLGLRHFHDEQSEVAVGTGFFTTTGSGAGTFVSNNPRLNFSYKTSDDGLLYANVAKGFRSGVFNLGVPNAPPTAAPESLWTYMIGSKQEWFGHRLSTDLSVYYNDWSNLQALAGQSTSPLGYYTNTGKASGSGANFALTARATRDLTLSATVGYTDMHHDETTATDNKGDPVDLVAKWTYSAALDYRHPLVETRAWFMHVDYQHTGGYEIILRSLPPGVFLGDARNLLNARVGIDFSPYQIYIFGTNLTDNGGTLYPAIGTFLEPVLPPPRLVGIGGKVSF